VDAWPLLAGPRYRQYVYTTTTISATAALLAAHNDHEALDQLLIELGFTEPALQLDELAREGLGLPYGICAARVARAEGGLRALLLTVTSETSPPEIVSKIAARFALRMPHLLWLVVVLQPQTALVTIAAWNAQTTPPRIAALIIDRSRVVESDAETVCALTGCTVIRNDVLRHAAWLEVLGREAVIQRVYRVLERMIGTLADSLTPAASPADARQLAVLCISRLLFLSFLETKGWLNNDCSFLANGFSNCLAQGGHYHQRVLSPLFFGTLQTRCADRALRAHAFGKIPFLNGGLFSRTPLERQWRAATFSDDALGTLYKDLFQRYRFTPHLNPTVWSDAVIDPQMLGHVFEALLLGQGRISIHACSRTRHTDQAVVDRLVTLTLAEALSTETCNRDVVERALAGELLDVTARGVLLDQTAQLRILDPVCGSGAFLVSALEQIAALRARLGDLRPLAAIRRSVLTTSIHGVDSDQIAIWLCKCRLWLSTVIESEERDPALVLPLPNVDSQIRVGGLLDDAGPTKVVAVARFGVILGNTTECDTILKRSADLLLPNGALGLLIPAMLWRSPAGAAMRTLLQTHMQLLTLEDRGRSSSTLSAIGATTCSSFVIARPLSSCHPVSNLVSVAVHRTGASVKWHTSLKALTFGISIDSTWLLIPPPLRAAFDNVVDAGMPLEHSGIGPLRMHDINTADLRITWSDVGRSLRATVLQTGEPPIPLNTCHVIYPSTPRDAYACVALLNTPLAAAWLGILAGSALDGLRRRWGGDVALLPVPRDWSRAREILAPLGERAAHGELLTADELHGASLQAYRLHPRSVEPLLIWDIHPH
jgi:hypothetical protein